MSNHDIQLFQNEGRFGNLDDIEKIERLAIKQEASIYSLNLQPAEHWRKPKVLSGVLFIVLISGQVLFRILSHENQEESNQFMIEDSTQFISPKDSFNLESLYKNTKILILQLPSTASCSDAVNIDLRYFSNSEKYKHVSQKIGRQRPFYK